MHSVPRVACTTKHVTRLIYYNIAARTTTYILYIIIRVVFVVVERLFYFQVCKSHQHLSRNEYITKTHKYIDQTKLTVLNSRGMCFAVTYNAQRKYIINLS